MKRFKELRKDVNEVWSAMSGPFMLGLAFAMATIAIFDMNGAIICMACILLVIQGLEKMD